MHTKNSSEECRATEVSTNVSRIVNTIQLVVLRIFTGSVHKNTQLKLSANRLILHAEPQHLSVIDICTADLNLCHMSKQPIHGQHLWQIYLTLHETICCINNKETRNNNRENRIDLISVSGYSSIRTLSSHGNVDEPVTQSFKEGTLSHFINTLLHQSVFFSSIKPQYYPASSNKCCSAPWHLMDM